ncbi:hypothetical protein [Haladaptatus paucihalophilus]|uniref:Uncharacterized protein n=1 Tax=Haladaptatus paucihalophilus DX253 TaxID=797209 RepID=A0A1M7CMC3_HALPU|nr:hypothetical protein [Haladaptatus paucihalophilus]SHL68335.1 hypothetical protein SAMN05444342_4402 [Haladaptatus paucihalophilus DX253]
MSEKDKNKPNRRIFLQSVGVGAIGTTIGTGTVSGSSSSSETTSITVDQYELLQTDEVQSVLATLGNPSMQLEKANASAITFDSGESFKMVEIPTDFGTLFIGSQGSSYTEATILLNNRAHRAFNNPNSKAGNGVSFGWNGNAEALATNTGDGVSFVREANKGEQQRLARILDQSPKDIIALRNSEYDAFLVTEQGKTNGARGQVSAASEDASQFWVDLSEEKIIGERTTGESGDVSTQLSKAECLISFGSCAADLAFPSACSYCGLVCKSSKLTGWAGYAACFICISHICGGEAFKYFMDCGTVVQCIDKYIVDVPFV